MRIPVLLQGRAGAALAMMASTVFLMPSVKACGSSAGPRPALRGLAASIKAVAPRDRPASDAALPGMWKVVYTSGDETVDLRFTTIHSDGTELGLSSAPILIENVCMGVWEKTGARSYTTLHTTWDYDPSGTVTVNVFVEQVHLTISADGNSFTGDFVWNTYDSQGNQLPGTVTGSVTGERISVGSPLPFPFPF